MQPLVKILKVKTQHKFEITMSHAIGERVSGAVYTTELKIIRLQRGTTYCNLFT